MSQALHIFKKDVRCFRFEILFVLLSAWISVRSTIESTGIQRPRLFSGLLALTGTLLISVVIHAEAIPGSKLQWLTRPYRWKSLLAAKLLFLFLFVSLPPVVVMFISQVSVGIPVTATLWPLLIWEVQAFLFWVVPVAAVAAVTENIASFFIGFLFVGAFGALLGIVFSGMQPPPRALPFAASWVSATLLLLVFACGGAAMLFVQYRKRATTTGRIVMAGSVVVAYVLTATPFTFGMRLQSLVSRPGIDHSAMTLAMNNEKFSDDLGAGFRLDVKGTPAGLEARPDALIGEIVEGDTTVDFSMRELVPTGTNQGGARQISAYLSPDDIKKLQGKRVTVRGSVYVTLRQSRNWKHGPFEKLEPVVDGVWCQTFKPNKLLECHAIMGSPRGVLEITPDPFGFAERLGDGSYWPYPNLDFRPYTSLPVVVRRMTTDVEFRYWEPVSHFRLNFNIPVEHFLE